MNHRSLPPLLREGRFWCLLAMALAAIFLGFLAIPDFAAIVLVSKAGYWIVLLTFVVFLHALWKSHAAGLRNWRAWKPDWATR
jgi:hypothetical protein